MPVVLRYSGAGAKAVNCGAGAAAEARGKLLGRTELAQNTAVTCCTVYNTHYSNDIILSSVVSSIVGKKIN